MRKYYCWYCGKYSFIKFCVYGFSICWICWIKYKLNKIDIDPEDMEIKVIDWYKERR